MGNMTVFRTHNAGRLAISADTVLLGKHTHSERALQFRVIVFFDRIYCHLDSLRSPIVDN